MADDVLRRDWHRLQSITDDIGSILADRERFTDGHEVNRRIREVMHDCGPGDFDRLASALTDLFRDLWAVACMELGGVQVAGVVPLGRARHARDEDEPDDTQVLEVQP